MAATTERAILAGGCFWGMQQLVQRLPGVVSTRVGYSGGNAGEETMRTKSDRKAEGESPSRSEPSSPLGFRLRLCPLGRGPEPGR